MADTGRCEQCGAAFTRRREHARFCSPRCRAAWNRARANARAADEQTALAWSMAGVRDAVDRLRRAGGGNLGRGLAAVNEAVWWVTLVDATLLRYHPDVYDAALASHGEGERRAVEDVLAGLRFVRNQMGYEIDPADFITRAGGRAGAARGRVGGWVWRSLPAPALESVAPRRRRWEMTRYRAYEARLAGRTVGETFAGAASFLELTFARTAAPRADSPQGSHAQALP